jgi:chemotaxis protein methyltransferase CheR
MRAAADRRLRGDERKPAAGRKTVRVRTAVAGADPELDIGALADLANKGDWAAAAQYCRALLKAEACNPSVHYYHALIAQYSGLAAEAEQALKRAIYLDQGFALAHYQLGLVRKDAHDLARCRRSFHNALSALGNVPDEACVSPCGQITAFDLRDLAARQLVLLGQP